jgi:hypothetical protein
MSYSPFSIRTVVPLLSLCKCIPKNVGNREDSFGSGTGSGSAGDEVGNSQRGLAQEVRSPLGSESGRIKVIWAGDSSVRS